MNERLEGVGFEEKRETERGREEMKKKVTTTTSRVEWEYYKNVWIGIASSQVGTINYYAMIG